MEIITNILIGLVIFGAVYNALETWNPLCEVMVNIFMKRGERWSLFLEIGTGVAMAFEWTDKIAYISVLMFSIYTSNWTMFIIVATIRIIDRILRAYSDNQAITFRQVSILRSITFIYVLLVMGIL